MKAGGSYTYKYADVADVLSMARPVLAKHKIALVQTTSMQGGALILVTRLAHDGQWFESDYPVCQIGADHKEMGSALTYARRYAASAILGVASEDDADGEGAARSHAPERAPPPARNEPFPGDMPDAPTAPPTLADAARALEVALRSAPDKATLKARWDKNAKLCAKLDTADPDLLAFVTKVYDECEAALEALALRKAA
jgi:hypothetical protein